MKYDGKNYDEVIAAHKKWITRENGYSEFNRADFSNADLTCIRLHDTDLSGAIFTNADLSGGDFYRVNLSGADLNGAKLHHSIVVDSRFEGAAMQKVDFSNSNIKYCSFKEADLRKATFKQTTMTGAVLTNAYLENAVFNCANIRKAFFLGAHLEKTDFRNTNLSEAHIEKTDLKEAIIPEKEACKNCRYCKTIWSNECKREEAGHCCIISKDEDNITLITDIQGICKAYKTAYNLGTGVSVIYAYRRHITQKKEVEQKMKEHPGQEYRYILLKDMGFSARTFRCLTYAGCRFLGDIIDMPPEKRRRIRSYGEKSEHEVLAAIRQYVPTFENTK